MQSSESEKFQKTNKNCENVSEGKNDFDSISFGYGKESKKTHKVRMSACRHGDQMLLIELNTFS